MPLIWKFLFPVTAILGILGCAYGQMPPEHFRIGSCIGIHFFLFYYLMHYSKLKDPGLACLKGMIVTFTAYAAYCFSQASFMKGSIAFALTIVLFLSNDFFEGKMEKKGSC